MLQCCTSSFFVDGVPRFAMMSHADPRLGGCEGGEARGPHHQKLGIDVAMSHLQMRYPLVI